MIRISGWFTLFLVIVALVLLIIGWVMGDTFIRNLGFAFLAASVFWLGKTIKWNIDKERRRREFEKQQKKDKH